MRAFATAKCSRGYADTDWLARDFLLGRRADIKLVLIGQGKLKPALQARAAREGLDNVVFAAPVAKQKIAGLMAVTDVGLQTLANVEAFYYGTSPNKFFDYIAAAAIVAMSPTLVVAMGRRGRRVHRLFFIAVAAVLLLVSLLGADRFLQRFDAGLVDQMRAMLNAVTYEALREALPFGTGLGTFPSEYAVYEKSENLRPEYANRAHDDWLEFPLEAGVPGILLIVLFLVWFSLSLVRVWMRPLTGQDVRLSIAQQCASLVVLLLLLHSVVDYPLRTSAMLAYFSACCGLMICLPAGARQGGRRRDVEPELVPLAPQLERGSQ